MLKFINGKLYCRKEEDVKEIPSSVVADIKDSYTRYMHTTVKEDVEYFAELLRERLNISSLKLVMKKPQLVSFVNYENGSIRDVRYLSICVDIYNSAGKIRSDVELFKVPAMEDYGKFNVNGSIKTVVMQLRSAYDISMSDAKKMLNVSMPKANLRIAITKSTIGIMNRNKTVPIKDILISMLYMAGDKTPLSEYLTNSQLVQRLDISDGVIPELVYNNTMAANPYILNMFDSEQYKLSTCREAINAAFGLGRGLGMELAEPILNYPEGTLVTESVIKSMYRARVGHYNVHVNNYPDGYYLADDLPEPILEIPEGTKNCAKLRLEFPEYASMSRLPYIDLVERRNGNFLYMRNFKMESQDLELLDVLGYKKVLLKTKPQSTTSFEFSFTMDIVGNYMARYSDLTDNVPADVDADDWVYYFNNPNLTPNCPDKVTVHDLLAMVSFLGEYLVTGRSTLLNRDTSFLKRVMQCGDLFSESLRQTMQTFVRDRASAIASALTSTNVNSQGYQNPFLMLTHNWYSKMLEDKILATVDTVNLSAEVSQATHVTTQIVGKAEVVDEQRQLAMPFFGRICPFETPAGPKLGVVNTRAIGSRIKDGLLETPYRMVLSAGDGIRISNTITYMTVRDEIGKKFCDQLSLKKDENGKILNTMILARVPNPDKSDEPFIFKNIHAYEMAGGYVSAYPEQSLCSTAALIPFCAADNPVRVSFGLSQLKQAINLVNSEKPLVTTPMYEQLFDFATKTQYLANVKGTIVNIEEDAITIKCKDDGVEYTIPTVEYLVNEDISRFMHYFKHVGDSVQVGDVVAESVLYPQDFVVRAPQDGVITRVDHEMIEISNINNPDAVDLSKDEVSSIQLNSFRQLGNNAIFLNLKVSVGDAVKRGDILADTCTSREGVYSPSRNPLVAFAPTGYNYEDAVDATTSASMEYISFLSSKLQREVSTRRFPYVRSPRANSFKYYDTGQVFTKVTLQTKADNSVDREIPVNATRKAHGIFYNMRQFTEAAKRRITFVYTLLAMNPLQSGDKMSGRHGNKGVVSRILDDSKAPQLANGMVVRFILGPCGVPSRMNLGQVWEMHASLIAKVLSITIDSPAYNGATSEEIAMLMKYTYAVCNNVTNESSFWAIASAFPKIPREMHEWVFNHLETALDYKGVFDVEGNARLFDPETFTWFEGKATIGYPMFNKLMQESEEKLNARAGLLEEEYSRITGQPQDNINSAKGQRMAEMELVATAAYGAASFIKEILNEKSDNNGERTNAVLGQLKELDSKYYTSKRHTDSRAVMNLLFMLESVGVKTSVSKDVIDIDSKAIDQKFSLNMGTYLQQRFYPKKMENSDESSDFDNFEDT